MGQQHHRELNRNPANFRPLTPIHFLLRAADVFPNRVAVIYGETRFTWREHAERCRRLASALTRAGIGRGDTVAILCPNTPPMLEAHFGVPMAGAVLCTINTRLDPAGIGFILGHSEARVLIVDRQLGTVARDAVAAAGTDILVIDIDDPQAEGTAPAGAVDYESFLNGGDPSDPIVWPEDEWDSISINYTSGTTGNPKGAVYHHRGAYLNALGQLFNFGMSGPPTYLWTLPLFHCNGWCYSWAIAALAGTHVCLRRVAADTIYQAIDQEDVTHLCCAPTILGFMIEGGAGRPPIERDVHIMTAGAAPPAAVLQKIEDLGFSVVHVYGMTEMHGVISLCEWQEEWNALPPEQRASRLARQGVRTIVMDEMMVADPATLAPVPSDGATIGEVMMRGSVAVKGYFKNPKATGEAFAGGWYHSGDLAVVHPDGYIEIKDRSKDIIISGGENISSIEVEDVLYRHPAVQSAAVVARKDERWGEVPCAFVELTPDAAGTVRAEDIIAYCRDRMAHFKCPRHVIFGPIERTATGKIQKFKLREAAERTEL